ncbi:TEL2-interacting protein 1 [Chamberlinius hualienensis]
MSEAAMTEINCIFALLRPYCTRMVQQPSKASVDSFNDVLKKIEDDRLIQKLQCYLLIEMTEILSTHSLQSKTLPEFLTDYLLCIRSIIARTEIRNWEIFNRIISRIVMFIMKYMPNGDKVEQISDELEIAAIGCLTETIKRSTEGVLEKVYSRVFLEKLGAILFHLQNLFLRETCREVQIAALESIKCIIESFFESTLKTTLPDPIATFVPGLSVALVNLATGNHGSAVIVVGIFSMTAIETWTSLLVGVFGDDFYMNNNNDYFDSTNKLDSQLVIPRKDKEWVKLASKRLSKIMPKMAALDGHSNWKVRKTIVFWVNSLLTNCKRKVLLLTISLSDSVSVWLDVLISLSVDEYPSIQTLCENSLNDFSISLKPGDRNLLDIVNDSLFALALQLPKYMKQSDEIKIVSSLNQLYGYIKVLGFNVNIFLDSSIHLEKLSLAFMKLAEIDVRNVHIVSETSDENVADKVATVYGCIKTPRQFLNFSNDFIYQRICQIWQTLGKYGNLYILVDHMLDRFHQSSVYKNQAVLILNEIIVGFMSNETCDTKSDLTQSTLKWIVDEYLEPSVWNLEITRYNKELNIFQETVDNETMPSLVTVYHRSLEESPLALNSNVVLICLCLEGIGVCAQTLKEEFKLFLRKVLYEVLEKCGSNNLLVSHTAMKCIYSMALSCGYSDTVQLIMENSDYLLNSITLKLIHRPLDPKVPVVLNVSLQFGTKEMLVIIEDVVTEMLNCIDRLTDTQLVPYISVLNSFCLAVLRWFPHDESTAKPCNVKTEQMETETVKTFILNFHHQTLISQNVEHDKLNHELLTEDSFKRLGSEMATEEVVDDNSPEIFPPHIKIVAKVLERCGHLLPISTPIVCFWVVSVINNAVRVLHGYDNILFPSVHKIWPSLSNRFKVENHLVVQAAFKTLCTLVDACRDFVRSRIMKEVWPKILDFLGKESKKKNYSDYSQTFKLLQRVLLDLGTVAKKLDLDVLELDNLASCALLFTYQFHHRAIRMAASKLLDELLVLNTDLMWLKLQDLTSEGNEVIQKNIITGLMDKL